MRHKGLISREKQKLVELNEIKTTYYKRIRNKHCLSKNVIIIDSASHPRVAVSRPHVAVS